MKNSTLVVWLAASALALGPLAPALAQAPAAMPVQPLAGPMALSLAQAVRFAVANKPSLLSTRLAEQTAAAKVGEVKSQGLPQLSIGTNVADNFKLQKSLVDLFRALGARRSMALPSHKAT